MKKTINGIRYDFESHISDKPLRKYNQFDYDAEYCQVINGIKFFGVREFRVSKKTGAYYEYFVYQGVKYSSELQFAKAVLQLN